MKTSELLTKLREIFSTDTVFNAWCNNAFGKLPWIYLGLNRDNKPPQENYPVVVIYFSERAKGEDKPRNIFHVGIGFGVSNENITTDTPNKTITYDGLLQVEDFREEGENAIYRAKLGKVNTEVETENEVEHPMFRSYVVLEFDFPRGSRTPLGRN